MKKTLIVFIILTVCATAGAVWIGYDTAKLHRDNYVADTRDYEPVSRENTTTSYKNTVIKTSDSDKTVSQDISNSTVHYRLRAEYGYVVIYNEDGSLYDKSDIKMSALPKTLQIEILNGKELFSERELYNFLETYST